MIKKASVQHLIKYVLLFELAETNKRSIIVLLRPKNLRFLRRTNLIKTRCATLGKFVYFLDIYIYILIFYGNS